MSKVYYEKVFEICDKCSINYEINNDDFDDIDYYAIIDKCEFCKAKLMKKSTISEVFFIMRQWKPNIQKNMRFFINLLLSKQCGINDRDGVTDMTMLMYACKSGGIIIGNDQEACELVKFLIEHGADLNVKSIWLSMNCYHICAFFDCYRCLEVLLNENCGAGIDTPCELFDNGTALHIACINKCIKSAHKLIKYGANINFFNNLGHKPFDYIKNKSSDLSDDLSVSQTSQSMDLPKLDSEIEQMLNKMNLKIHDRVLVSDKRLGYLRYCGATKFANGIWAGVELDKPSGKHDGSLCGMRYFSCNRNHGIFCQLDRLRKATYEDDDLSQTDIETTSTAIVNNQTKQISEIKTLKKAMLNKEKIKIKNSLVKLNESQRLQKTLSDASSSLNTSFDDTINIGTKINFQGHRAVVRYVGTTHFGNGIWFGLEFKSKYGKNDGSIEGVKYFECEKRHGLFVKAEKLLNTLNRTYMKHK